MTVPQITMESPPLPVATHARYPSWVLLDANAYFDDGVNSTTAHALTPAGNAVRVTFCLASPPFVSHFCLPNYSGPVVAAVVSSAKDLVLLRVRFTSLHYQYLVYQAAGNNPPSLRPIPPIHPGASYPPCVLPCDDDDDNAEFLVADLSKALDPRHYILDVFSSKTNRWVTRPLQLQEASPVAGGEDIPRALDKVVWLGGGAVAWIDLWQGIVVCDDVRDGDPVLRFIPLPKPGSGFSGRCHGIGTGHRQQARDVTFCCDGFFKFVEMDRSFKYVTIPDGWKIRTCYRHVSWDYWHEGHVVDSEDIVVSNPEHRKMLPQLWDHNNAGRSTLGNLSVSYPTLSTGNDDVVYLMCEVNIDDRGAWMVGVDLGKKTVEVVENIADYFQPPFLSCSFS